MQISTQKIDPQKTSNNKNGSIIRLKKLVFTAMLAAISFILMKFLPIHLPFVPGFLTFDFSDMPALLASLSMGPVCGVAVCLVKNLIGMTMSNTGCVGELSNFVLSVFLVLPAGIIANKSKKTSRVVIACVCGAVVMALMSIISNYFLVYPIYTTMMPMEVIIGMYKAILPSVDGLLEALLIFNVPFTFAKGACAILLCLPLYKRLRPFFGNELR